MKLSIIIPVHNNWNFTRACLNYFHKHNSDFFEIIIFDNGSNDSTLESIKFFTKNMNNLIYIRNEENLGFAAAVNRAFKSSIGKYVLFLNNDVMFATNSDKWMKDIINCIDTNKNCLVGPTGGYLDEDFNFHYETSDNEKKINYMSGWCLCASRKTWNSLILPNECGPFDSKTFYVYFEDTDLGFRAKNMGIKFVLCKVPMHHIGKQTSKKLNVSMLYADSRNNFIEKWQKKCKKK